MFETLKNAWRIDDLRKKIIYTLLMLLVYRVGSFIPVPGIDSSYVRDLVEGNTLLGLLDIISGGAFANFTIFAMGITPYINASIIMQLLTVAIPRLEQLAKEGQEGQKKIAQYTRYATVVLAFIQAIGITYGLAGEALENRNLLGYIIVALTLTAGTAFLMWLGEQITDKGIGNGISLLIFTSIISRLPVAAVSLWQLAFVAKTISPWSLPIVVVFAILLVAAVIFVDSGERRIPVQYAKRVVGRKVYGGQSTHIPLKVNSSGVLPIIFAVSILSLPQIIAQFFPGSGFNAWVEKYFHQGTALYGVLYALFIIFFTFFYTQITFNPVEIANNLRQYGGFVQGIRPGKPTADYLARISNRITLVGSLFLVAVAIIPIAASAATNMPMYFGGTAILIVVGVALETVKQLEAQMLMRHYRGFLK
ncbi:preprotein translocase subunit SecY [Caldicoprobacter faecalis]|uniref:Protein translocase subunit SecY n=1 Tax=Caldicoprobacter faecalis TaxID=937334 RepID=A0A1I5TXU3_9FIRM|nr:preprotein translocase subunit SecY [Caldicoprobacter faecalis]SFP87829.1 protein translocase subunit secY/sec61 alpha [Caldicoprobacter faecalis]